ncbi:MAG: type II toxin-antitoxin system Phd/YefM family antitoxin [Polyangiales bacterium]
MKPLRVSQDIVPMAEFKGQAAHWFRRLAENNQPVVITQNGKPAGVLLSPAEFDRLVERERFLTDVATGVADLDAGRVVSTDELTRRLGLGDASGG